MNFKMCGLKEDRFVDKKSRNLLAAGVLGDSLGSLGHGVLGQLTGQKQTDGGLDFSAGDGRSLVVVGKTRSLAGDSLEDVVHEGVHDRHGLAGDTGVRVYLLQHLVDVDGVRLPPPPPALSYSLRALRLSAFLSSFCCFTGHSEEFWRMMTDRPSQLLL